MDNIFIMHEDKVFLRLMAELAVMHLARDWKLRINRSWNIHRTCDGIDFCGQKIFADHALGAQAHQAGTLCPGGKIAQTWT